MKNFCSAKNGIKRKGKLEEKYLQKTQLIKDFYPKYTKNSLQLTIRKESD